MRQEFLLNQIALSQVIRENRGIRANLRIDSR